MVSNLSKMGACFNTNNPNPVNTENFKYEDVYEIHIKERDARGRLLYTEKVVFRVKPPLEMRSESISLGSLSARVHGAILPSMDPKNQYNKDCQDLYFFETKDSTFLAGLFDGHGEHGQKVVRYCVRFMKEFYESHHSAFTEEPISAIQEMIEECDRTLRESSRIDVNASGTTGVVLFISEGLMTVGSVGDSRGVLASTIHQDHVEEDPISNKNPYKRLIEPTRHLHPVQLTIDHKPNHETELKRINESGGVVQQLTNEIGDKIGPFRVWQQDMNRPGIAMSRSIGDETGKAIGVISTPTIHQFPIYSGADQFVVMGSDGVWDVISNSQAVNFIEKFRAKTLMSPQRAEYPVRV